MSTTRKVILAAAALAITATQLASPAQAVLSEHAISGSGTSRAVCTFSEHATVTPGVSMTPSSGNITTKGETGSILCVGSIRGRRGTGPGTWGVDHPYGPGPLGPATCLQSSATGGKFFYTVPTASGPLHVEGILD